MTAYDDAVMAVKAAQEVHRPLTAGWPGGYHCSACPWEDRALLWDRHMREVAVDASAPILLADLRERLAAATETHRCEQGGSDDHERGFADGWNAAIEFSARLMRERP